MENRFFNNISFTVNKGDKIAIVADDQMAITAFFEIINGELNSR